MTTVTERLLHAVSVINDSETREALRTDDSQFAKQWQVLAGFISEDHVGSELEEGDFHLLRGALLKLLAIIAKGTGSAATEVYIWKGETIPSSGEVDYYFEQELGEYLADRFPPESRGWQETLCQSVAFTMANFFTLSSIIGPFTEDLEREIVLLQR